MRFSDEYIRMVQAFLSLQQTLTLDDISDHARAECCRQMIHELDGIRAGLLELLPAALPSAPRPARLPADYNPADVCNQG